MHVDEREARRLAVLRATKLLDSEPEESFDRVTRLAAKLLRAPVALVSLVDQDRQFFKSHVGLPASLASECQTPLSYSFCKLAIREQVPFSVTDAVHDPRVSDNPAIRELGVQAYLGIPLLVDEQAIGSFCVMDVQPRMWSDQEIAMLSDLADWVTSEIQRRASLRASRAERNITRALLDGVGDAVVAIDPTMTVIVVNSAAHQIFPDFVVGATLPHNRMTQFQVKYADGSDVALHDSPMSRAIRGEITDNLLLSMQLADRTGLTWFDVNGRPVWNDENDIVAGVVTYKDVTTRQLEIEELQSAHELLENQAAHLRTAARTDDLTGLHNRRGFMALAERECKIAVRHARQLLVIFIDLDGFKQINDVCGHDTGDRAIQSAAQILRKVFRETDVLARLGGDEFAVVALGTEDEARVLARLDEALRTANAQPGVPYILSMSLGSAAFDPKRPNSIEKLLALADARMYARKSARRAAPPR